MQVSNYSEFRKNLKAHLDKVTQDREPLVVHRQSGKTVVVVALEDYNAWEETEYLLSTKANRERIQEAIKDVKEGNLLYHKLIEE